MLGSRFAPGGSRGLHLRKQIGVWLGFKIEPAVPGADDGNEVSWSPFGMKVIIGSEPELHLGYDDEKFNTYFRGGFALPDPLKLGPLTNGWDGDI